MSSFRRSRARVVALLLATVVLGLSTRRFPEVFTRLLATYGGDALWTSAAYWVLALACVRASPAGLGASALGISALVELSQLVHAPWLDAIRRHPLGALVLGQGFLWSDLVCYAAGAAAAAVLDRALVASTAGGEASAGGPGG
jgi:hypothetical protein